MRILLAVALALTIFLSDSAVRLILIMNAPHLAPLIIPAERSKLTQHLTYDGYSVLDDYDGTLYHIYDNQRQVIGQPTSYTHTIWVLGNSGSFGLYVSDADTMESHLQSRLPHTRIVNASMPGEYIAGEYARLKVLPVQRGDVVVFDDGGMDLTYGRCTDNRYAMLQLICQTFYDNTVSINDFNRIATLAQNYTIQHGATFYHFIQPTPCPQYERGAQGIQLIVPNIDMMDAWHLTPEGEKRESGEIYNALFQLL